MEQQKDNQHKDFFNKGQNAPERFQRDETGKGQPQQKPAVVPTSTNKIPVNQAKQGFGYVLRKTEKLTTALYLVTDIMSDKEPMKWKARETSVELLSDITIASSLSVSERMTMLRNAIKKTEKISAFLDVAQSAHLMSEMNASMLKKEYLALKDNIESEWNSVYEKSKSIFSDSFFDVPRDIETEPEERKEIPSGVGTSRTPEVSQHAPDLSYAKGHEQGVSLGGSRTPSVPFSKNSENSHQQGSGGSHSPNGLLGDRVGPATVLHHDIPAIRQNEVAKKSPPQPVVHAVLEKRTIASIELQPREVKIHMPSPSYPVPGARPQFQASPDVSGLTNSEREAFSRPRTESDRDDRRKIVLALIKQKPALTVKDIAKSIPNISEKTIQRELLAMVAGGILSKKGERRWSTYSLRQG